MKLNHFYKDEYTLSKCSLLVSIIVLSISIMRGSIKNVVNFAKTLQTLHVVLENSIAEVILSIINSSAYVIALIYIMLLLAFILLDSGIPCLMFKLLNSKNNKESKASVLEIILLIIASLSELISLVISINLLNIIIPLGGLLENMLIHLTILLLIPILYVVITLIFIIKQIVRGERKDG